VCFVARVIVILLACLLATHTPLVYADPPDPLWMTGYWDDDDFDSVVVFLLGNCAIQVGAAVSAGLFWTSQGYVELLDRGAVPTPVRSAAIPRAPPVAFSPA
jgi:hypothetical protein